MEESKKRKREESIKVYSIFIDFDETLSDNHIDEDVVITEENFIDLCYNGKEENYNKIKNALHELKKTGNYEFYVLSRNENKLLKEVIPKMFPDEFKMFSGIFKEILIYSDLTDFFKKKENRTLFSTLKSEYTERKRTADEPKQFAVIKRELALSKAVDRDRIILIDDSDINIRSFINVGNIALKFSHHYNKEKKYLNEVLIELDSNIKKYNEPVSSSKYESKTPEVNRKEEITTTPKNVGNSESPETPDVKQGNLFGSGSGLDSGKKRKSSKRKSKSKSKRKKKSKSKW